MQVCSWALGRNPEVLLLASVGFNLATWPRLLQRHMGNVVSGAAAMCPG